MGRDQQRWKRPIGFSVKLWPKFRSEIHQGPKLYRSVGKPGVRFQLDNRLTLLTHIRSIEVRADIANL